MDLAWAVFSFKVLADHELYKSYWAKAYELSEDNEQDFLLFMRKAKEKAFVVNISRLFCFVVYYGWNSLESKTLLFGWHVLYVLFAIYSLLFVPIVKLLGFLIMVSVLIWNCILVLFFYKAFEIQIFPTKKP